MRAFWFSSAALIIRRAVAVRISRCTRERSHLVTVLWFCDHASTSARNDSEEARHCLYTKKLLSHILFISKKKENYPRSIALQWSRLLILSAFFGIAALDSERRDILSFRTLVVSIRLSSVSCSSQLYLLCKAFSSYPAEWVLSERNDLHRLHRSYHFFVYSLRLFEYCRLPSFTSSQFHRLLKFLILRWAPFQQFSMYSCFFILTFRLTRKQWRCLLVALLSRLKDSFCLL